MSKRKNRERAKHFIFRDGRYIPRHEWDKHQQELSEMEESKRLARIGLVRAKPKLTTPEEYVKERLARKAGE